MVKQWKLERNRRIAEARTQGPEGPVPAGGPWPVFFCEKTGDAFVTNRWWCRKRDCAGETREPVGRVAEGADVEFPTASRPCPICGEDMPAASQGWPPIYRRTDTGTELNPNGEKLPPGAVWASNPDWGYPTGEDGRALWCQLPDGHVWGIDGMANNCTMRDDTVHRCWVRRGRPEDGTLHVGKDGHTCAAGAGSIATPKFHGFLHVRNGRSELYSC